jgi:hypothetical protein
MCLYRSETIKELLINLLILLIFIVCIGLYALGTELSQFRQQAIDRGYAEYITEKGKIRFRWND